MRSWEEPGRAFVYLYRLRFGYFIGGDSGSGAHHHPDVVKPRAMRQHRSSGFGRYAAPVALVARRFGSTYPARTLPSGRLPKEDGYAP